MKMFSENISRVFFPLLQSIIILKHRACINILKKVKFNERDEVLDNEGAVIDRSNIAVLIQHTVRDLPRNIVQPDSNYFLDVLRETNNPHLIVNYES